MPLDGAPAAAKTAQAFAELTRTSDVSATAAAHSLATKSGGAPVVLYLRRGGHPTTTDPVPAPSSKHNDADDENDDERHDDDADNRRGGGRRSRLAFFFLARDSPEMTGGPNSCFARISSSRRELESFAVRSSGYKHTGRGFAGVVELDVTGAASAVLTNVIPNQVYKVALTFAQDPSSTPVWTDSLLLRETHDDTAAPPSVVLRALPHSPWTFPFLRNRAAVEALAMVFTQFVTKATHFGRPTLATKVAIRGVGDALCEAFIAAVYKAVTALRAVHPSLHRGHTDPKAGALFTTMTVLGAVTPAAVRKGPWILDWFDFCLLALLPGDALPRVVQLAKQFHSAPRGAEGEKLKSRVEYMALPDIRTPPEGTPVELYAETPASSDDFVVDTAQVLKDIQVAARMRKSAAAFHGRGGPPAPQPTTAKRRTTGAYMPFAHPDASQSPLSENLQTSESQRGTRFDPIAYTTRLERSSGAVEDGVSLPESLLRYNTTPDHLRPAASDKWSAARAILSLCSVRQQLLILEPFVLRGVPSTAAGGRRGGPGRHHLRRFRVRRGTDDTDQPGYNELDSDEEWFDEIYFDCPPEPIRPPPTGDVVDNDEGDDEPSMCQPAPWTVVRTWCTQARVASLAPSTVSLAKGSRESHARLRLNSWRQWARWQVVKKRFRKSLFQAMMREHEASLELQALRDTAKLRAYNRFWCHRALGSVVDKTSRANETRHLRRRFETWAVFAAPTPFRVKRPPINVEAAAPSSVTVAVFGQTVRVTCRLGTAATRGYEAPVSFLSSERRRHRQPKLGENAPMPLLSLTADSAAASAPQPPPVQGGALTVVRDRRRRRAATPSAASSVDRRRQPASSRSQSPPPRAVATQKQKLQEQQRDVTPLVTLKQLKRAFPLAAKVRGYVVAARSGPPETAELFDAERAAALTPLVHALWAVNGHRERGRCFHRWRAFARGSHLQRRQQEFVDRTMIPVARSLARARLRFGWTSLQTNARIRLAERRTEEQGTQAELLRFPAEAGLRILGCTRLLDRDASSFFAMGRSDPYVVVRRRLSKKTSSETNKKTNHVLLRTKVADDTTSPCWCSAAAAAGGSTVDGVACTVSLPQPDGNINATDAEDDDATAVATVEVWDDNGAPLRAPSFLGCADIPLGRFVRPKEAVVDEGERASSDGGAKEQETAVVSASGGGRSHMAVAVRSIHDRLHEQPLALRLSLKPRAKEADDDVLAAYADRPAGLGAVFIEVGSVDAVLSGSWADIERRNSAVLRRIESANDDRDGTDDDAAACPQLTVRVVGCDNLRDADGGTWLSGVSDPFVELHQYLHPADAEPTRVLRTDTISDNVSPRFDRTDPDSTATVKIPRGDEAATDALGGAPIQLTAKVFNWNAVESNDLLGTATVDIAKVAPAVVHFARASTSKREATADAPAPPSAVVVTVPLVDRHNISDTDQPPSLTLHISAVGCADEAVRADDEADAADAPVAAIVSVDGCADLLDRDSGFLLSGQTDPYVEIVAVFCDSSDNQRRQPTIVPVGRTGTVADDCNPRWEGAAFAVPSTNGHREPLMAVAFKVWNANGVGADADFLGAAEVPASALAASRSSTVLPLRPCRGGKDVDDDVVSVAFRKRDKRLGTVTVTVRQADATKEVAAVLPQLPLSMPPRRFQLAVRRCTSLRTRESGFLRGDSDPFVIVTRQGRALKLATSAVVDDDLNPLFDDGTDARAADGARLVLVSSSGDREAAVVASIAEQLRDLCVTVWDYNPIVAHERMGTASLAADDGEGDSVARLMAEVQPAAGTTWGAEVALALRPRAKEADPVLRAAWNGAGATDGERVAKAPLGSVILCGRWLD